MEQNKILEAKKEISKFMGCNKAHDERDKLPNYDMEWGLLMGVVEKIDSLKHGDYSYGFIMGFNTYSAIVQNKGRIGNVMKWESSKPYTISIGNGMVESGTSLPNTRKESVFMVVSEFATWYNKQKQ